MKDMSYEEAVEYIHSLYWKGKKTGLEKTKELLDLAGHPEYGKKYIHIAGTNGKGSTAAMLDSVLRHAGYRVGLYTSPYICEYNERIQADGANIPNDALARLTTELSRLVEKMETPPSEFEFGTVLAFLYFKETGCEYVVLETGLGGTYDSTNVIADPLLCIITALGFDHTALLGDTMEEIASAKAGIIKENSRVVFYGDNPEGEKVIASVCKEKNASLSIPDFRQIVVEKPMEAGFEIREGKRVFSLNRQQISYKQRKNLLLALSGSYQRKNAAVVCEAIDVLRECGVEIPEKAVYQGLENVFWQARLEVLSSEPIILVDGSHNPQGMQATLESLREYFPEQRLTFVFGAMADKDLTTMISMLLSMAKKIILTAPALPRAQKPAVLCNMFEEEIHRNGPGDEYAPKLLCTDSVPEAVEYAKNEAKNEVVVMIGSLYLAGEAKNYLRSIPEKD